LESAVEPLMPPQLAASSATGIQPGLSVRLVGTAARLTACVVACWSPRVFGQPGLRERNPGFGNRDKEKAILGAHPRSHVQALLSALSVFSRFRHETHRLAITLCQTPILAIEFRPGTEAATSFGGRLPTTRHYLDFGTAIFNARYQAYEYIL
jgi:hypothetical protein